MSSSASNSGGGFAGLLGLAVIVWIIIKLIWWIVGAAVLVGLFFLVRTIVKRATDVPSSKRLVGAPSPLVPISSTIGCCAATTAESRPRRRRTHALPVSSAESTLESRSTAGRITARLLRSRDECFAAPRLEVQRHGAGDPGRRRNTCRPTRGAGIAGMTVALDAGHNAVNEASINDQVPNGRGGTKACNTSGTAADDGYAEHTFNWAVVGLINGSLNQMGVHTGLTRGDDGSTGPCVDERAARANALHPDAIVSIHADGGPPSGSGFHVNYFSPPLNDAQSGGAIQLAHIMRDTLVQAGFHPATYIGSDGLYGRDDLAGLNLAQYPAVLVELGNMKNADDAARMESADGRAKYADAVTQGIVAYLNAKAG